MKATQRLLTARYHKIVLCDPAVVQDRVEPLLVYTQRWQQ